MTHPDSIKKFWYDQYADAPATLAKMKNVGSLAAAFNANVDSVVKMSGTVLTQMIARSGLGLSDLQNVSVKSIRTPEDILRGIFRCFCLGIAEEWIAEDAEIYRWMKKNLGTDKLQMGAQAGIIANTMAVTGIRQVITHVSALPALQADQFLKRDNLLSFDEQGQLKPAHTINRPDEEASIHWIIEFSKNDTVTVEGQTFTCPKSNRFIATYDPMLFNLVIDPHFTAYTGKNPADYVILSGYQALTKQNRGLSLLKKTIPIIRQWKQSHPQTIIHLEIASTQDLSVRRALIRHIMPIVDSVGVNERETVDLLEAMKYARLASDCTQNPSAKNLFRALVKIKQKTACPRIQLHMYGLYITLQNRNFPISPSANRNGMILAAVAAASKAETGRLSEYEDLTVALGQTVCDEGIKGLEEIGSLIGNPGFAASGIGNFEEFSVIAVPTIIVEQPKTLVGMGDTISAFSLIGAC